jgi:hypothetical protein
MYMASVNIWYELWVEVKRDGMCVAWERAWVGSSKERASVHRLVHGGYVVEVVEVRDAVEAVSS